MFIDGRFYVTISYYNAVDVDSECWCWCWMLMSMPLGCFSFCFLLVVGHFDDLLNAFAPLLIKIIIHLLNTLRAAYGWMHIFNIYFLKFCYVFLFFLLHHLSLMLDCAGENLSFSFSVTRPLQWTEHKILIVFHV